MDHFREEVAIRRKRTLYDTVYLLSFVVMVICAVIALLALQNTISMVVAGSFDIMMPVLLIVFGGAAFLIWRNKGELKAEYEYTFTNGVLDVAKVLNNQKRCYLTSLNMKDVTAAGAVNSEGFKRYVSMPDAKKHNWFLNRDAKLYYFLFTKKGVKHLMMVELSDEMADFVHRPGYMNHGVWQ